MRGARVEPVAARRAAEADRTDALERSVARVGAEAAVTARTPAARVHGNVAAPAAEARRTRTQTTAVRSHVAQT